MERKWKENGREGEGVREIHVRMNNEEKMKRELPLCVT